MPAPRLEQLKQEVRKAPRDVALRTFLFQLFCVFGEWERAVTQLTAAGELDPLAMPMAQAYRAAIRCELLRERVFAGARTPTIFADPEPWMSLLIEANRLLGAGQARRRPRACATTRSSRRLPSAAASTVRTSSGSPTPIRALGRCWRRWSTANTTGSRSTACALVDIEAAGRPARPGLDAGAFRLWTNGGEVLRLRADPLPRLASWRKIPRWPLARRTEWQENGPWFIGLGQRMLATDAADFALMDIRRIEVRAPDDAAENASHEAPDAAQDDNTLRDAAV